MTLAAKHKTKDAEPKKLGIFPPGARYNWWLIALPMLMMCLNEALLISMPTLLGNTIDGFAAGNHSSAWMLLAAIAGIIFFAMCNEAFGFRMVVLFMIRVARDWRNYTAELICKLPKKAEPGEVITVILGDSKTIGYLIMSIPQNFAGFTLITIGVINLWQISSLVALIALAGIAFTMVTLICLTRIVGVRTRHRREFSGRNAARASDIASSLRTIAGLGARSVMLERYRDSAEQLRLAGLHVKRARILVYGARVLLTGLTSLTAVSVSIGGEVINGVWTPHIAAGKLLAISGTVFMMTGAMFSFEMLLSNLRDAQVALGRIDRLRQQVLGAATEGDTYQELTPPTVTGRITYIDPRPAGVTAIEYAQRLTAQLRQTADDGAAPRRVLLSESNPLLFAGTLSAHLQLGTAGLTAAQQIALLELTDSLEIAYRLGGNNPEDFFAAEITSEGANLSGGQRQRLALARALAQAAQVLVLTEPLNSVDEPSQRYIYDQLEARIGSDPLLAHLEHVYVISTTLQVQQRAGLQTGHTA